MEHSFQISWKPTNQMFVWLKKAFFLSSPTNIYFFVFVYDDTYRKNGWCVKVDDALDVRACRMYSSMKLEAWYVGPKVSGSLLNDRTLHVNLDQARGRHLMIQHAKRVHQEMLLVLVQPGLQFNHNTIV